MPCLAPMPEEEKRLLAVIIERVLAGPDDCSGDIRKYSFGGADCDAWPETKAPTGFELFAAAVCDSDDVDDVTACPAGASADPDGRDTDGEEPDLRPAPIGFLLGNAPTGHVYDSTLTLASDSESTPNR